MPLVEIDLLEGRSQADLDAISDAVHEAMVAVLDVPQRDRFQIITERHPRSLVMVENEREDWSFGGGRRATSSFPVRPRGETGESW